MRLAKAWIVASKDLRIFAKKRAILYTALAGEVFVSVGLPLIIRFAAGQSRHPGAELPQIMNAFSCWLVIVAALLPVSIASYSLIGEKVQNSLEPLLATPTTDGEVLLGKAFAALIPAIAATYIGSVVFMTLCDAFTYRALGHLYYPNWTLGLLVLVLAPLACILSVEANVLVSSRTNDVRTAQQLGSLAVVPFFAGYISALLRATVLTVPHLLLVSAVMLLIDVAGSYVVRATFRRDQILTSWK